VSVPATINLTPDSSEGFGVGRLGADDTVLGTITSGNVACGFHVIDLKAFR
jgi:5-oxoprolinase (ATP-hydrolysing) subunit A